MACEVDGVCVSRFGVRLLWWMRCCQSRLGGGVDQLKTTVVEILATQELKKAVSMSFIE